MRSDEIPKDEGPMNPNDWYFGIGTLYRDYVRPLSSFR